MKDLIKDIMTGKVEMSVHFGEVEDSISEDAKRIFLEVFVDTEKYPQFKQYGKVKIPVFGMGLWIFKSKSKEDFLKIAKENRVTMIIPSSIVKEDDTIFYLEDLSEISTEDSVGIVEVALSSGMRNEFLYEDTNKEFVEFFDGWYRKLIFDTVKEKYNKVPLFKATQTF